jgi:hypothetical protein
VSVAVIRAIKVTLTQTLENSLNEMWSVSFFT